MTLNENGYTEVTLQDGITYKFTLSDYNFLDRCVCDYFNGSNTNGNQFIKLKTFYGSRILLNIHSVITVEEITPAVIKAFDEEIKQTKPWE